MNSQEAKQIVIDFFQHFCATNVDAALELLSEDVIWRVMGIEAKPPVTGSMDKAAVGQLILTVKQAIPAGLQLTPTGWTIEGDRIAVEMESYGKMTNQKIYNNHYHFLIKLSGDKIHEIKEYMDTYHCKLCFLQD
ncbi:nuclear transport factor 2 family protein [Persicirhabdus sediminis]|uniref:SnoaL-like domain-containing protein n=1 Tax=Persicirhabdus sediminis TaxID=454144 RepID=A0A8J7SMG9_9BACT|nr:nuclear transport factor 2 family protein [Persicirhabdus sediminis]MBK1792070.1 hypothetical protein [Persicirhabdus sediminis]